MTDDQLVRFYAEMRGIPTNLLTLTQTGLCLTLSYSFLVLENLNAFIYSHSPNLEPDESHRECFLVAFLFYFRLFPLTSYQGS